MDIDIIGAGIGGLTKTLSKIDLSYFEQKHNTKNIAIHRGKLQQILIDKLKSTKINLDYKLTSIVENTNVYELKFKNGEQIQSSTLLGADGLNSIVRQNLFPNNRVRNANQICWRGITEYELPTKFRSELNEAWGKSERFGFVQIAKNIIYWYALKSFKNNMNEFSINELGQYFSDYNSVIQDIIKSTKKEQINIAEISDLKPTNSWYKKMCV